MEGLRVRLTRRWSWPPAAWATRTAALTARAAVCVLALAAGAPAPSDGLAAAARADPAGSKAPGLVRYLGARLVDLDGGPSRPVVILTKGERIVSVMPAGAAAGPEGPAYRIPVPVSDVNVDGLYVSPGLINAHEHLSTPPDRPFAEAMMVKDLYGGVTAVRDMADDLRQVADLARAARVGETPGPDIVFAALMAGEAFFQDPRTAAVTRGFDGPTAPWMQRVSASTDLPTAVTLARGTGARAIKIYADLPAGMVEAITREAHRQGLRVWAHAAVFPATPSQVAAAGVDVMSHAGMLGYEVSLRPPQTYHDRAPVDPARARADDQRRLDRLFAEMRRRGVALDATLRVYQGLDAAHRRHPDAPAPYCDLDLAALLTRRAHAAGVTILAGTDGFSDADAPWPALQDELELLQDRAGLSPLEVLRAATIDGARALGEADMGAVAPGKLANLVFTRGDPARGAQAFRTIVLTVKRGTPYWRSAFTPDPVVRRPAD